MIRMILLGVAAMCFLLAAVKMPAPVDLTALGLFFLAITFAL